MISFYFCWWGKAGSKKRARRKSAGSWRLIWPLWEEEGFSRLRRWESHCRHRKQPGEEQKVWKRVQPLVTGSVSVRCTVQRGARSGGWGRHRNTQVRSKMRIPHLSLESSVTYTCTPEFPGPRSSYTCDFG